MTLTRTTAARSALWALLAILAVLLAGGATTEAATSPDLAVEAALAGDDDARTGDDDPDEDDENRDEAPDAGTPTRANDQTAAPQPQEGATAASAGAAAQPSAPVSAPPADTVRPELASVRPVLSRRSRAHRLTLSASEDVMLEIGVEALGRSRDLLRKRSFRVFAAQGTSTVRLPNMHLSGRRYRMRIVAVDRTGNRSAVQTVVAGVR